MIDYVRNFEWNGLLGILLYWVPLTFCVVFYTVRTAQGYMKDKSARDDCERKEMPKFYAPHETVGRIIGRALVSITPIANIWAACFDLAPKVFSKLFDWIDRVFDQPLVPPLR